MARSNRPPMQPRTLRLVSEEVRERALNMIRNLPIDALRPLEIVAREEPKRRKLDQNALLWAGPLRDIADQAWTEGRLYSAEIWAAYFKEQFLPEEFDPEMTMEGYRKWDIDPAGKRILIGSTTQLTVKGMSDYMEAIYAFGASMGVEFTTKESA